MQSNIHFFFVEVAYIMMAQITLVEESPLLGQEWGREIHSTYRETWQVTFNRMCYIVIYHLLFMLLPPPWIYASFFSYFSILQGLPSGSECKESACSAGDLGSVSGWGRSPG